MADIEIGGGTLSLIAAPAATDRVVLSTGAATGGYTQRGDFVWKQASGVYLANGPFEVAGTAKAGGSNTTSGLAGFVLPYNNGFGGTFGSLRSSGDISISKNCHPSPTTGQGWVSSVDTAAQRSAIVLGNSEIAFHFGASTTTPIGSDVTLAKAFGVTTAGASFSVPILAINGNAGAPGVSFASDPDTGMWASGGNAINFSTGGGTKLIINSSGQTVPFNDNAQTLGAGSNRWSVVYAGTGTINTSDDRDKTWRGSLSSAELSAARRIAAELGIYQWNDAIAEKGPDGARLHFGVRAQTAWDIMADEGLIDPIAEGVTPDSRYAFLCYDQWPAIDAVEEVLDENENVITAAEPGRPAGNRFGIRPDQLALFLIAAQEARLVALEAA